MTDNENISHLLLNEDLVQQVPRKKVKLVRSSQQDNALTSSFVEQETNQAEDQLVDENFVTLNPEGVSQYLYGVESGSQVADTNVGHKSIIVETSSAPVSEQPHKANVDFEQPKDTSTPANRK